MVALAVTVALPRPWGEGHGEDMGGRKTSAAKLPLPLTSVISGAQRLGWGAETSPASPPCARLGSARRTPKTLCYRRPSPVFNEAGF